MERLTERDMNCPDPKTVYGVYVKDHDYVAAAHRLADYEDTGLTPVEIHKMRSWWEATKFILDSPDTVSTRLRELYEADKAGLVVVLPCKVGDTVYTLLRRFDGADVVIETELWWTDIPQIGKTVFLTREGAEKALEEAKRDG